MNFPFYATSFKACLPPPMTKQERKEREMLLRADVLHKPKQY